MSLCSGMYLLYIYMTTPRVLHGATRGGTHAGTRAWRRTVRRSVALVSRSVEYSRVLTGYSTVLTPAPVEGQPKLGTQARVLTGTPRVLPAHAPVAACALRGMGADVSRQRGAPRRAWARRLAGIDTAGGVPRRYRRAAVVLARVRQVLMDRCL
jgi:hypothetical protein